MSCSLCDGPQHPASIRSDLANLDLCFSALSALHRRCWAETIFRYEVPETVSPLSFSDSAQVAIPDELIDSTLSRSPREVHSISQLVELYRLGFNRRRDPKDGILRIFQCSFVALTQKRRSRSPLTR